MYFNDYAFLHTAQRRVEQYRTEAEKYRLIKGVTTQNLQRLRQSVGSTYGFQPLAKQEA